METAMNYLPKNTNNCKHCVTSAKRVIVGPLKYFEFIDINWSSSSFNTSNLRAFHS